MPENANDRRREKPPITPSAYDPITLIVIRLPERAIEGYANDVIPITPASEVGAESTPDRRGLISGIRGESAASQRLGSAGFVQFGIVDRVACDFTVDTFVSQLLLEQSSAAGSMRRAVFDPASREIGVVQVAPLVQPRDRVLDSVLLVAAAAQAITHLLLGARTIAEEDQCGLGGLGCLFCREQRANPVAIEHIPDVDPLIGDECRGQGKCERTIEVNRNPVRIALGRSQRGDPAGAD
jgi:hypothetical protein